MRILFLTGSPAHYMAPPQLGDAQIVAGPDWPDAQSPKGDWISIKTPIGDYNVATLFDKLPADQQPDAVVSLVDASWRRQPRTLRCYPANNISLLPNLDGQTDKLSHAFNDLGCKPFDQVASLKANPRIAL